MWRDARFVAIVLTVVVLGAVLMFARPMILIGAAYDPDGQPVPGAFAYSSVDTLGLSREAAEGSSSHRFFAGCLLCVALEARVRADGFESQEIQISPHLDPDHGDRLEVWRSPLGVFSHARVTLYPAREIEARRVQGEVVFKAGTPLIVLALHPEVSGPLTPERLQQRLRQRTRSLDASAPYIALEAATAADGSLAVDDEGVPLALYLTLHNAEGGFVQVPPLSGLPGNNGYRATLRRLREAPAAGYVPRLRLDPARAHQDGNQYHLFLRIDDRFGRLELPVPWVGREPGDQISARLEVVLNSAAGRALPTR